MDARPAVDDAALGQVALAVLDGNWTGAATVPAPGLYPHQWSWDSTLVAIGLSRCLPARAQAELSGVLDGQWANGMIPHVIFRPAPYTVYFPGPEVWRSGEHPGAPKGLPTSGITQPPGQAYAAWWIWRNAADHTEIAGFIQRIWPILDAQHQFLTKNRDLLGWGLAVVIHPWESGIDDSPIWDGPLRAIPSDGGHHERYVSLAVRLRNAGYDPAYVRSDHPFAVVDPLFNGVWLASTLAMAELAPVCGKDPLPYVEAAARIRAGLVSRLWDPVGGTFVAWDARSDSALPVRTVSGFVPMVDPELPSGYVRELVELLESQHFMGSTGYPVPSCDTRNPAFDRERYWRGPSWVSTNWLLLQGARTHGLDDLADRLSASTLRLVRHAGFRECFDPFDGSGRGVRDFAASAALTLDLLDFGSGPPRHDPAA